VFTDLGKDSYSLNSPFVAESVRPYPGEGIHHDLLLANKGVVLIPENRRQTQVISFLLLSWFVLTAGSIGLLLLDMARSTPTPRRSRLVWVLVTTLFGPFGFVAYFIFYRRPQHASIHEVKRTN
jgi:hypothetical protein